MAERIYNVLFLCTGNSAESIMAEALDRLAIKQEVDEIGHLRAVMREEPAP